MTGKLTDVTDATFKSEVLDAEGPVLVDFWAPWCGPCRVVHPVLEEIDGEREDLKIVTINVDENQQTAAQYEVLSIPTMILFKDGAIAKKVVGAMPKRRLEAELEPALAWQTLKCRSSTSTGSRAAATSRRRRSPSGSKRRWSRWPASPPSTAG